MTNAILFRMPSGIPGDISRRAKTIVETVLLNSGAAFSAYGLPGKISAGKFVPIAGGEAGSAVKGFLVRPYPVQTSSADGSGISPSPVGDMMAFGYMTVLNNAGAPAKYGQVYVRVANAGVGKPIGGIEAASETAAVAAAAGGNTGNGVFTIDAGTPVLAGALAGVYTARCITAAANGGIFEVKDPNGYSLGQYKVGDTFADQIKFVIADGATDFIVGDQFNITVTLNTVPIPGCVFEDVADASGNVEIRFAV